MFPGGYADTSNTYHFVDLWSRKSTWGGGPLPEEGDSIVIPAGTTVLLDVPKGQLPMLHTVILLGNLKFDGAMVGGAEPEIHLNVRSPHQACPHKPEAMHTLIFQSCQDKAKEPA
jgi:hypothetical protein